MKTNKIEASATILILHLEKTQHVSDGFLKDAEHYSDYFKMDDFKKRSNNVFHSKWEIGKLVFSASEYKNGQYEGGGKKALEHPVLFLVIFNNTVLHQYNYKVSFYCFSHATFI